MLKKINKIINIIWYALWIVLLIFIIADISFYLFLSEFLAIFIFLIFISVGEESITKKAVIIFICFVVLAPLLNYMGKDLVVPAYFLGSLVIKYFDFKFLKITGTRKLLKFNFKDLIILIITLILVVGILYGARVEVFTLTLIGYFLVKLLDQMLNFFNVDIFNFLK